MGYLFWIFFFSVLIYLYKKYMKIVESVAHIPGPAALPFIGNALLFVGKKPNELVQMGSDVVKKFGLFNRILLGPKILILIGDPKDVEALLTSQKTIDKSEEYDFAKVWIGEGLITSTGSKWHSRRKIITPAFHFNILQSFVKIFNENAQIFVDKLRLFESVDIYSLTLLCALDNICGKIRLSFDFVSYQTFSASRSGDGYKNKCTIKRRLELCQSCGRVRL